MMITGSLSSPTLASAAAQNSARTALHRTRAAKEEAAPRLPLHARLPPLPSRRRPQLERAVRRPADQKLPADRVKRDRLRRVVVAGELGERLARRDVEAAHAAVVARDGEHLKSGAFLFWAAHGMGSARRAFCTGGASDEGTQPHRHREATALLAPPPYPSRTHRAGAVEREAVAGVLRGARNGRDLGDHAHVPQLGRAVLCVCMCVVCVCVVVCFVCMCVLCVLLLCCVCCCCRGSALPGPLTRLFPGRDPDKSLVRAS